MPLRCVVLISGRGSLLPALISGVHARADVDAQLVAVVSNRPGAPGLGIAAAAGIEQVSVDHKAYPERARFEQDLGAEIDRLAPDLLVLAGFMRILTPEFVMRFSPRMLNTHPSLLPDFPGLDTHARALARGDGEAGATVHVVTPELDAGPILAQVRVPVLPGDDAEALQHRVHAGEQRLYPEVIRWVAADRLRLDAPIMLLDGAPLPSRGVQFRVTEEALKAC